MSESTILAPPAERIEAMRRRQLERERRGASIRQEAERQDRLLDEAEERVKRVLMPLVGLQVRGGDRLGVHFHLPFPAEHGRSLQLTNGRPPGAPGFETLLELSLTVQGGGVLTSIGGIGVSDAQLLELAVRAVEARVPADEPEEQIAREVRP